MESNRWMKVHKEILSGTKDSEMPVMATGCVVLFFVDMISLLSFLTIFSLWLSLDRSFWLNIRFHMPEMLCSIGRWCALESNMHLLYSCDENGFLTSVVLVNLLHVELYGSHIFICLIGSTEFGKKSDKLKRVSEVHFALHFPMVWASYSVV